MKNQSQIKQAFREVYSVERTHEGAARFLGFFEVFQKHNLSEDTQMRLVNRAQLSLMIRKNFEQVSSKYTIERRLWQFKHLGRRTGLIKNY